MIDLYKTFFLFFAASFLVMTEVQGQENDSDLIDEYLGDSIDWVDTDGLDYEDFKEITGFGGLHNERCAEPNVDINIGYYKRLFDVKLNYEDDLNCTRCQLEAMYDIIYGFLDKGLSFDEIKRKLAQQDFLRLVSSDDNKLFSIQWDQGLINHSHYVLVHQVADGVYHVQNKRLYYYDDFDNVNTSCQVDKIKRIKNTSRYIIQVADLDERTVNLYGVNLVDNILKKEYMFGSEKWQMQICYPRIFTQRQETINLDGTQLSYPVFKADAKVEEEDFFSVERLFYNGFCFTDINSFNSELADIEAVGEKKVGRKYRLLSESSDWIEELYSKTGLDFVIDRYTDFKTGDAGVVTCRFFKTDMCPQLKSLGDYPIDSISLYLPSYEGRMCVDGLTSALFKEQLLSHYNPEKKSAPQPIYIAGYDEAFSYEKVRYTAVLFDKVITPKDAQKVRWAVMVDNKVQYLDKSKYKGMQIHLDINPKWEGKVIKVMPYIGSLDEHFYCETEIISRL